MFFIGPNDLSCSIGKFAQYEDPEFVTLFENAENAIKKTGKLIGSIPYGNFNWQAMFDRGFQLTTAGSEVALLREVAVKIVREYMTNNPNNIDL
jgi:4-hydroxy-2-oxoheptanedioate aldolase